MAYIIINIQESANVPKATPIHTDKTVNVILSPKWTVNSDIHCNTL